MDWEVIISANHKIILQVSQTHQADFPHNFRGNPSCPTPFEKFNCQLQTATSLSSIQHNERLVQVD